MSLIRSDTRKKRGAKIPMTAASEPGITGLFFWNALPPLVLRPKEQGL